MQLRALWSYLCWIGVDAVVLTRLRPDLPRLAGDVSAPHAWVERVGTDGAAATLAGATVWIAAAWLSVGLLASLVAVTPGALGRSAARVSHIVLPRVLYRVVAGATGAGVLLAPTSVASLTSVACAEAAQPLIPAPVWPRSAPAAPPAASVPARSVPERSVPSRSVPPRAEPPRHDPPPRTSTPITSPTGAGTSPAEVVTVRPGDSLWSIAARRLGVADASAISTEWRRIYAANRGIVGADPDLIHPGQRLVVGGDNR